MNDHEAYDFELRLRRIKPATPPEAFTPRLLAAKPLAKAGAETARPATAITELFQALRQSLRWLIPATAVAVMAIVVWRASLPSSNRLAGIAGSPKTSAATAPAELTADDVRLEQQLLASFDAVARLPGGEPVRFRCENWMDQLVLSDKARGVVVENRKPRFEVVALGFETY